MKQYDFIVYGNNTAAMVSALQLGQKYTVALVNPVPNWGAHFAGTVIDGTKYDVGMNFLEFTTFHHPSDDLLSYNPAVRNDSARFFHRVASFFESRLQVSLVPEPKCYINGAWADDLIISNHFDILLKLPAEIRAQIQKELLDIVNAGKGPLHASLKNKNEPLFLETDFKTVSVANHGQTFHDLFIEPFCHKIFNLSASQVPALFHRVAWAPLFYPETLLEALQGKAPTLPPTVFHYPVSGHFAAAVEVLMEEIKQNSNITIITQKPEKLVPSNTPILHFAGESITAPKLIWATDINGLLGLAGIETDGYQLQKASLTLVFLQLGNELLNKQFSTLYVCDTDTFIYRITNQDFSAGTTSKTSRLVFELNHDLLTQDGLNNDETIIKHVAEFLNKSGILTTNMPINEFTVKHFRNSVNLPVRENFNNFQNLHKLAIENLPGVELIGMASGYTSASFNDQVVQALVLEAKYC